MLTVLLGGARSGKSALAVDRGRRHAGSVAYIATSPHIDGDADLAGRIGTHRNERPPEWTTIEEEIELADAIASAGEGLVIVDCLTVWVGNLFHHGHDERSIDAHSDAALAAIKARDAPTIAITNEVGLGIVPDNELARNYRDVLGRVNQSWVAAADRAALLVAGRAMPLAEPATIAEWLDG